MSVNSILNYIVGNPIERTDSYKVGHWLTYRQGLRLFHSYMEARGFDADHGANFAKSTLFGLQYQLMNYYLGSVVTKDHIDEAEDHFRQHFPYDHSIFNRKGWETIVNKHGGILPLSIYAVPEGTALPLSNVLFACENTHDDFPWITNYLESDLTHVWYGSTVAAQCREFYMAILVFLYLSGTPSTVHYRLHDFGYRGVTCIEQAAIGGAAHLALFKGTDNFPATRLARAVYGSPMAGHSIFATEHSNMTSAGDRDNPRVGEPRVIEQMLRAIPNGPLACVSDTFGIYEACDKLWGKKFKEQLMRRNGTLVVRPDSSGKTKDGKMEHPEDVMLNVINILWSHFGGHVNEKGYRVLDPHISTILGDGVDYPTHIRVMRRLIENKFSVDNIHFGSGGALLQKISRDTLKHAFKGSYGEAEGIGGFTFFKDPYHIGKKSKQGRLRLYRGISPATGEERFVTLPDTEPAPEWSDGKNYLVEVYRNGEIPKNAQWTWEQIRHNLLPTVAELSRVADRLQLPVLNYARDNYFGTAQQS